MNLNYFNVVQNLLLRNKIHLFFALVFVIQSTFAGNFWIWNITSIVPPIFFTLLYLLWVFYAITKKTVWHFAFVLLFIPLAIYNSDINLRVFVDQPSQDSETFSVFNWNTQFWETDRKEDLYKFLLAKNADVYHLQEHILRKDGEFFELDDLEEIEQVFKGYSVIKKTEFLTITRLPIVRSFENEDSYYLRVDVQVGKNELSLYNVHMPVQVNPELWSNPSLFLSDLQRRFYLREEQYAKLIDDIKENVNEFYISGDFNTTRSMGKIHEVLNLGKDTVQASNNFFNATWTAGSGIRLWRIDYSIAHKGLKILNYTEVNPYPFSDHWAQLVTVQL